MLVARKRPSKTKMKIYIEHQISETEMFIYGFNCYLNGKNQLVFNYCSCCESRRNDKNDVWGHLWGDHYHEKEQAELKQFKKTHDYEPNDYRYDSLDEDYYKISQKYNPVMHKTAFGKPYYGGLYASSEHLPKIPFSDKELTKLIKKEFAKMLTNVNINR